MQIYFVEREKGDFVLELAILNRERKGTKYGYRKLRVCRRGTLRQEFCMWSEFSKVGLNLIR